MIRRSPYLITLSAADRAVLPSLAFEEYAGRPASER